MMNLNWSIILICVLIHQAANSETVGLANGEWPPYTSKFLPNGGPYTQIVTESFNNQGLISEVSFYPWVRSFVLVQEAQLDASPTWQNNPERAEKVLFSDPVITHQFVFFHREQLELNWNEIEDLRSYRIGVINGYSYGPEFDEAMHDNQLNLFVVQDELSALQMLQTGRIHLFPSDLYTGLSVLNSLETQLKGHDITFHSKPVFENTTSVIFSDTQKGFRLKRMFNSGLKKLKQSGRYQDILEEAGLSSSASH